MRIIDGVLITARIERELDNYLKLRALKEQRSKSYIVRRALLAEVERWVKITEASEKSREQDREV